MFGYNLSNYISTKFSFLNVALRDASKYNVNKYNVKLCMKFSLCTNPVRRATSVSWMCGALISRTARNRLQHSSYFTFTVTSARLLASGLSNAPTVLLFKMPVCLSGKLPTFLD